MHLFKLINKLYYILKCIDDIIYYIIKLIVKMGFTLTLIQLLTLIIRCKNPFTEI